MLFPFHDNNPTVRTPYFTLAIIAFNTIVYVWMLRQPDANQLNLVVHHGFIPKRVAQLADPKLVVGVQFDPAAPAIQLPADPPQIYSSVLTTMFMHGGWLHLLGNMWFLWIFGNNIEDRLGHAVFLFYYLVGGLVATACHYAYDPNSTVPVIGASGAVAAVLGGYAVTYPTARVRTLVFLIVFVTIMELPALIVLGAWFVMQLIEAAGAARVGVNGGNVGVAWWAHVGGFISGLVLMPILSAGTAPPGINWQEETERQFGPRPAGFGDRRSDVK